MGQNDRSKIANRGVLKTNDQQVLKKYTGIFVL